MNHPLSATLLVIVEVARGVLAKTMRRAPETAVPRITFFWGWLFRAARRLDRILATPYVAPRPRPSRTRTAETPAPDQQPKPALPTWHWLRRVIGGHEINGGPSLFEHFLRDPDVHALLARDPRAVRLFRGLCRRFSIARAPDLPAVLFAPHTRRKPGTRKAGMPSALRDPRPIIERTAVCPDTGRRTFVPWTAEMAEYRRQMRPLFRAARRAETKRRAAAHR